MENNLIDMLPLSSETVSPNDLNPELIVAPPPVIISGSLDPYAGPWTEATAKHLLYRTMYGPTKTQIEEVQELGLNDAVEQLLSDPLDSGLPINYNFLLDPTTPVGQSWVFQPELENTSNYRRRSLRAWLTGIKVNQKLTVHEKMTLFWHNHFVTSDIRAPKFEYQYYELLRTHALGNFRTLAKEISVNPAMLRYLNGNQNTKNAPNENYARELLELFTVGKGDLAGPGDYSTFTEDDVREAAKVMTGWKINYNRLTGDLPEPFFISLLHDTSTKKLSHHFDSVSITNGGEDEYKTLIDIIFASGQPAYFLARKLYRWFVYYYIDETIEQNVIEPLAQVIIDNDYELKPTLAALFSSEHFYDVNSIGCQIKNPADFVIDLVKQFEIEVSAPIEEQYALWYLYFQGIVLIQMEILNPGSVAGWKAFYQEPSYNRLWINSVTLPIRLVYTDLFSTVGIGQGNRRLQIDIFKLVAALPNPLNPNEMIRDLAEPIFPLPLSDGQITFLKEVLIPGLPDEEWTIEYTAYLNDPENELIKLAVELKLRQMLKAMLGFAEYHLQ
jgi:uncharacterized protein (DUF1800 family)